jgi:2-polyprenyl-3-methyl-5-hydroxy-6-metoxy-1,4-benzoquinol methylase
MSEQIWVRCNLCGSKNSVLLYPSTLPEEQDHTRNVEALRCTGLGYGLHGPIVRCQECGLVYISPRPNGSDLIHDYEEVVDELYLEERDGRVLTFERHLRPLEKITGPPNGKRLLDVGCHIGVFVDVAHQHGWDVWGLEPSHWAAERAQAQGLRVRQGTLATADFEPASFDVITLWDVIEHVPNPLGDLARVYELLKPGGLTVLHTIDIESPFARLMGHRWPWLMEMHLYYFSPRTLRRMLEDLGFEVLHSSPQGRYLRLGYLVSRLKPFSRPLYRLLDALVTKLNLRGVTVSINLGDLFTMYARKPSS